MLDKSKQQQTISKHGHNEMCKENVKSPTTKPEMSSHHQPRNQAQFSAKAAWKEKMLSSK